MRSTTLPLLLLALSLPLGTVQAGEVRLAPHRIVYDLTLAKSLGERGLEDVRGRIAFEFTGNACEGYTLKYRQVTVMQSGETGTKTSDLRTANYESGDGKTFRFRNDTQSEGATQIVDGSAERRDGSPLAVRLRAPKRTNLGLPGEAVFPNAQMRDLIAAAREGRKLVSLKVFDGSDDGRKVYDTLAVIGQPIDTASDALEPAARQDGIRNVRRWPVTLSYFNEGRGEQIPVYTLSFDMYENGISRALRLDYGNFALKGEMTRLELLPDKGCQR